MAVWWNWQTQGTCESPSGSLKGQHFPFAPKIPRSKQPCEFESRYRHQYIITLHMRLWRNVNADGLILI